MLKEKDYEVIETVRCSDGNIVHISKLCKKSTQEEIDDFYKFIIKLNIKNENRTK